jgi:transposase
MSQENTTSKQPLIRYVNRQQMSWRAVDMERLIGEDRPARALWTLVGRLDLSPFYRAIESSVEEGGRPAFDPQLLISLWGYAYSQGIGSAREVARRCEYDPTFQWLTGLQEVNYHTLADFRVEKQQELDELFTQVLAALSKEGLITLEKRHEDQGEGEHQELSPGGSDSRASGEGATAGGGDGRSPERREQSESQASPGPRTARAARATGECAGRVREVAGTQERRKGQAGDASEHQRSARKSHAPARWRISTQLQRADFHRCDTWTDCGSGGDAGGQRQRSVIAGGGSRGTAAQEKAATAGGRSAISPHPPQPPAATFKRLYRTRAEHLAQLHALVKTRLR